MGFFEKVKNMFTEEVEDDDVKVEQIKKEVTKVTIESPKVKDDTEDEVLEAFKYNEESNKPVFFDDNDFKDLNLYDEPKVEKVEEKLPEKEIYGSKIQMEPVIEKKNFKPTPIISPVYGILNKNYHKEDIVSRNEIKIEKSSVEPSIDSIRNKAFGTLEDELENTLFGSNSILFKKDETQDLQITEVSDDVLTDLTDDISKELDELIMKKEKYVDEIALEEKNEVEEDLLDFIDSTLYKDGDE